MSRIRHIAIILLLFLYSLPVHAFEITSDPQYVVINFADFYFLNWQAPEQEWQKTVKPKAKEKLRQIKTLLTIGTPERKLAWSTLLEYTNFPMDVPSESSPYVIQAKRIMEIAEEEHFTVFMPLNGVQWWDELPELWNYWDYDGNQTPGCTNENHSSCQFKKLQDLAYRKRFIEGYNPDNKWNVDWQDWEQPMSFSTRNWGGGDVLVAPPPNIALHTNAPISFRQLQTERYEVIISAISKILGRWEKTGNQDLFAGLTIGTEVSLNGAVRPGDDSWMPYGYRALEDMFCPKEKPTCGTAKEWSAEELHTKRKQVLNDYFSDLAFRAVKKGIPKQRIYSHVWSEAEPGERKYTNAFGASTTLFSRPGLSIYGKATNPFNFSVLVDSLKESGYPAWAAPEFAPLTRDDYNWNIALNNTLNNQLSPAKIIDIYNERDILGTPAIPQIRAILQQKTEGVQCHISEVLPVTANKKVNPAKLEWKTLDNSDNADKAEILIWRHTFPTVADTATQTYDIKTQSHQYVLSKNLKEDFYYWSIKRQGCQDSKWTTSTPRYFVIKKPFVDQTPSWVKFFKKYYNRIRY